MDANKKMAIKEKWNVSGHKYVLIAVSVIIIILMCFGIFLGAKNVQKKKMYEHAMDLFNNGDYSAAAELFDLLDNYHGADKYAKLARSQKEYYDRLSQGIFNDSDEPDSLQVNDDTTAIDFEEADFGDENADLKKSYNEAKRLKNSGEYAKAAIAFGKIKDYADAKKQSFACWDKVPYIRRTVKFSLGWYYSIQNDGTVATEYGFSKGISGSKTGDTFRLNGKFVSVDCSGTNFFGLKNDGTISVLGEKVEHSIYDSVMENPYQVESWDDIVAIFHGHYDYGTAEFFIGLKMDGTLNVLTSDNSVDMKETVQKWTDIVSISIGRGIVGLKSDGTCEVYSKYDDNSSEIYKWTNIKAVYAGDGYFGIRNDGTVLYVDENDIMKRHNYDFSQFTDIVDLTTTFGGCIGLKSNGDIVYTGITDEEERKSISKLKGVQDIFTDYNGVLIGEKNDGSVIVIPRPYSETSEYTLKYSKLKNKKIINNPIMF